MSADRETNHGHGQYDAAHTDIAFLLADAADEVEVGTAPYQAVVRGGRRRRARRWAVAAAAAPVIAGSTGTLALVEHGQRPRGRPGGRRPSVGNGMCTTPSGPLSRWAGTAGGSGGSTPSNLGSAAERGGGGAAVRRQIDHGEWSPYARISKNLVGRGFFSVSLAVDDVWRPVMQGEIDKAYGMSGTDLESAAIPLEAKTSDQAGALNRLVIGRVAARARTVTCTWDDGTTSVAHKVPANYAANNKVPVIRPVAGSQAAWFVCLGGRGEESKSVKVTE